MSTVRIEVRVINIGSMRADRLPRGGWVVLDGLVQEVHNARITEDNDVELIFRSHDTTVAGESATKLTVTKDHVFRCVVIQSHRTEIKD